MLTHARFLPARTAPQDSHTATFKRMLKKGFTVYDKELLPRCILKQELDTDGVYLRHGLLQRHSPSPNPHPRPGARPQISCLTVELFHAR